MGTEPSPTTDRLAGLLLMIGAGALPFIIVEYVSIMGAMPADASAEEMAAFVGERLGDLQRGWRFEVFAMTLLGVGALGLMHRAGRIGWAMTLVGVLVTAPMYPLMIGGYGATLGADPQNVSTYLAFREIATVLFIVGNALIGLGLAIALAMEARHSPPMPKWLLYIGALANASSGLTFTAFHFDLIDDWRMGAIGAIAGFVIVAVLGASIARRPA